MSTPTKYAYIPCHPKGIAFPHLGAPSPDQAWENLSNKLALWVQTKRTKEQLIERGFSVCCWSPKTKSVEVQS